MQTVNKDRLMDDFDPDKYIDAFCDKRCDGHVQYNCEGCGGLEGRQKRMYDSILKRRLKKESYGL